MNGNEVLEEKIGSPAGPGYGNNRRSLGEARYGNARCPAKGSTRLVPRKPQGEVPKLAETSTALILGGCRRHLPRAINMYGGAPLSVGKK